MCQRDKTILAWAMQRLVWWAEAENVVNSTFAVIVKKWILNYSSKRPGVDAVAYSLLKRSNHWRLTKKHL
jgi:hypothetical protein